MNFVKEVEIENDLDTIFLSKKVSDQISAISLIKGSSILANRYSFLLRFPNSKKGLPPYFPSARLKKFFHLPWFPESRLRVVPHFSSGIVERAKRERA